MATVVAPVNISGVDWKSVVAGAIAASAVFGLLTAFGTALGLSLTSAHRGSGVSGTTLAIVAALWIVMVHVWSFVAGGYLAGRLSDVPDLHPEEAEFRAFLAEYDKAVVTRDIGFLERVIRGCPLLQDRCFAFGGQLPQHPRDRKATLSKRASFDFKPHHVIFSFDEHFLQMKIYRKGRQCRHHFMKSLTHAQ